MLKNPKAYWAFIMPALSLYILSIALPILYSFVISFTTWDGIGVPKFVGTEHYVAVFSDPVFWFAVRNNLLIIFVSVFMQIPLGFFLAYFLYRKLIRFPAFFESAIFFPTILSTVVVGLLFNSIFSSSGVIEQIIRTVFNDPIFRINLYNSKNTAIVPILILIVWMYSGTYFVIFLANMQTLSKDMIGAAIIDGASEFQIMVRVVWPNLLPVVVVSSILAITGSLKSFDLIWVITQGGPSYYTEVMASNMFKHSMVYYHYGYGSAIAIITIVSGILLVTSLTKLTKKYT
jgi:multiple sugar transport system permease protein/raffinose/stachyose/melibiose transport system permease protein